MRIVDDVDSLTGEAYAVENESFCGGVSIPSLLGPIVCLEQNPNTEKEVGYTGKKEAALNLMDRLESISLDPRFDLASL